MKLPPTNKKATVYKLTHPDTGEFYFGSTTSKFDTYKSGGQWPSQMRKKNIYLERTIISIEDNKANGHKLERLLIYKYWGNMFLKNISGFKDREEMRKIVEMARHHKNGKPYADIGFMYDISRQRVHQILRDYLPFIKKARIK